MYHIVREACFCAALALVGAALENFETNFFR
jgi:hypothetical protein